jgi:hypothetical protein
MGASASFEVSEISVEPGGQAEVRLRVRNTGSVVDSFTFEPVGVPAGWVTVTPAELRLFPETEEFVTVAVHPPRSSETPLGPMTFAIRVMSAEDPDGSVAEELHVEIAEFGQQGGELHPRTSTGRTRGVHELAIDNHGNAAIAAQLAGIDADNLLLFEIKPPSAIVEPGTAAIAIVTVKPRKRFWRGQPKSLPFQVLIDVEGKEPEIVDGHFVQRPMVPKWFWKALLALLVLLILLWLLWQTLLKPTVESAARDSVEELIEAEVEEIDERLDAAGIPELGEEPPLEEPGGGGAPTTTTTTPPATTDPASSTDSENTTTTAVPIEEPIEEVGAVDFRIELVDENLGDAASASQPVPAGTRLEITDIVFQNPTGASGAITVKRGDETLFEVQMANFRDLDYHFVAPYVFEGGVDVIVQLFCATSGSLQPVNAPADSCRAAVSFAGFNSVVNE